MQFEDLEGRQQTIRARAYDATELLHLARHADTEQEEIETRLKNLLASALFACRCHERALSRNAADQPTSSANEPELEELLDRVKGVIEFEVPFLLLLTGQTREECRQQVETFIEQQIRGDALCRKLVAVHPESDALPVGKTSATRTLLVWALSAVDAVFQAKRHIKKRDHDEDAAMTSLHSDP